jgi:GntR family transcriptional regulator, carbon starvation induced regulator
LQRAGRAAVKELPRPDILPFFKSKGQQIFENPIACRNSMRYQARNDWGPRGLGKHQAVAMPRQQTGNGSTLQTRALAQIRADIVACQLMPNERLTLEALRERYGAGFSPIREALMQLAAEGLVRLEQNKGFRVASVSRASLYDLMQARIEIETIALRWSIENGGVEWEADLLAAFHRLSRHSKLRRSQPGAISAEWSKEHRAFHHALVAACNSPTMLTIRENLFERAERYVGLSIVSKSPPRNDVAEHEQIMQAALARNVTRALAANREHIERTTNKVAKALENHPEFSKPAELGAAMREAKLPLAG